MVVGRMVDGAPQVIGWRVLGAVSVVKCLRHNLS
jgi:hypothetical protein